MTFEHIKKQAASAGLVLDDQDARKLLACTDPAWFGDHSFISFVAQRVREKYGGKSAEERRAAVEIALWINNQGDNISDDLGNRIVFALRSPPPSTAVIVRRFTHIETSSHVRFGEFPHYAIDPLRAVTIGHLKGVIDIPSGIDEPAQLNVWKPVKVFRIAADKVIGTAVPGMTLYVTPDGDLVLTDGAGVNALMGTVTETDGAVSFVLATGRQR